MAGADGGVPLIDLVLLAIGITLTIIGTVATYGTWTLIPAGALIAVLAVTVDWERTRA